MKLLVDATMVKSGQAGIRSYTTHFVMAASARSDLDVSVLVAVDNEDDWGGADVIRTNQRFNDPVRRITWRQLKVPSLVRDQAADAVLFPAPEPVSVTGVPSGMIVHDIGPLVAPGVYGTQRHLRYLATLRRSLYMTDAVFAVSDSTMLDLIRWYGDLARGCQVAGPKLVLDGVCDDVPNAGDREDFALYVGSMLPHKNVSTIVRAFQERSSKDDGTPSELLLVGPNYAGEVDEVMNGSGPRVRHLGFVSDDELNELYRKARVLLFPSIFEGFGLPLVEAVAAGTPCIVSDLAVFRDIGREAVAAYVDHPLDPIAWREAIRNISGSPVMSGHVDWTPSATAVAETFKSIVR